MLRAQRDAERNLIIDCAPSEARDRLSNTLFDFDAFDEEFFAGDDFSAEGAALGALPVVAAGFEFGVAGAAAEAGGDAVEDEAGTFGGGAGGEEVEVELDGVVDEAGHFANDEVDGGDAGGAGPGGVAVGDAQDIFGYG